MRQKTPIPKDGTFSHKKSTDNQYESRVLSDVTIGVERPKFNDMLVIKRSNKCTAENESCDDGEFFEPGRI